MQRWRGAAAATILRLSGIYGPDRVPRAADIVAGRPIAAPATGYLNLIHVDDAAAAVAAVWRGPNHHLYVISDDAPVVRGEFYCQIARQCGVPAPEFLEPEPDAPIRARSETNKRVCNHRMKRDLISDLSYPTYREGLASILS